MEMSVIIIAILVVLMVALTVWGLIMATIHDINHSTLMITIETDDTKCPGCGATKNHPSVLVGNDSLHSNEEVKEQSNGK